jgi:beta-glucanase (GH16 family)
MVRNIYSVAAFAFAASQLAAAQTFTKCNPLKTSKLPSNINLTVRALANMLTECDPDPAFGGTVTIDFTKGESSEFTVADGTTMKYDPSNGAAFTINKASDAPTITSNKYLFYGKVEAVMQAAPGVGIVSSFVLQSDDLDEIDWEWLGGDNTQVQTNYYSKGDTTTYDRGGFSSVGNPVGSFHTYTINWTPQSLTWSIDGAVVRTLNYGDAKGGATYPQTPMQVKLGTWDGGGPDEPQGTVNWAGGYTNFAQAPFVAWVKSITITDYSNGKSGAGSYVYGDNSGTSGSIQISGGVPGGSSSASGTASATGTGSKTASGTATGTATKSGATSVSTTTSVNSTTSTTTISTTTVANSTMTTITTVPASTTTLAAVTTTGSGPAATSAKPNAAGKLSMSMAPAALVMAAFFSYLIL